MKKLLVAGIVLIVVVNTAQAADMPVKAPVAAAPIWTGFYVGGNVGYGWGNRNVNYAPNDPAAAGLFLPGSGAEPAATSFNSSGALGGVQLGYNWQFARTWLFGIETDLDWTGMKGSGSGSPVGNPLIAVNADERIKWFGTVRARLGYLPADNFLTYVTGGFAYGRVEYSGSYVNNGGSFGGFDPSGFNYQCNVGTTCFAGQSSGIATGWTAGAGLEYAVWKNVTLKAEYLYVSLAGKSVTETASTRSIFAAPTDPLASFSASYGRTSFNVARVGVNYRF